MKLRLNTYCERLVRLSHACLKARRVSLNWKVASLVPLENGKGDPPECVKYMGMSVLAGFKKKFASVLMDHVGESTKIIISENQRDFI